MTNENVTNTPISPSAALISLLQAYEDGALDDAQVTQLFQELIDGGWAWQLQSHYGRTAREFLLSGRCHQSPGSASKTIQRQNAPSGDISLDVPELVNCHYCGREFSPALTDCAGIVGGTDEHPDLAWWCGCQEGEA